MSDGIDQGRQQVAALRHGTVVDHLNPGTALKALEVLGLPQDGPALLGIHLVSEKLGRKDILKLSGVEIPPDEIARLALFGPSVTVCYIRDYRVVRKVKATLPDDLLGLLRCPNPNCITNHERVKTRFGVKHRSPLLVRCHFCERLVHEVELQLI
jgi:aspartate carbamoyltransferase regulatory subunit